MEYNPRSPRYWDAEAAAQDMRAAFDVCNGCRLCFNLCPAFPALFEAVEGHEDDVSRLAEAEMDRVADLCYQCKLCFLKCPYVPPHPFDLDFPRLMLRWRAIRVRRRGLAPADRFLGNPERVGTMGHRMPALANWGNRQPWFRAWLERRMGIDRRRRLPRFAPVRFSTWVRRHSAPAPAPDVVVFSTCTVEYHEPGIGQATMAVLRAHGMQPAVPEGQVCCGMPALDGGDMDGAIRRARQNVAVLAPHAQAGRPILALQPTCAYVLKKEYPLLLGTDEAKAVASATQDVTEYLAAALKSGRLPAAFARSLGTVTYQVSCHTKAQGLATAAKSLLEQVPGTTVSVVDACAGIDGTWGFKAEFFDLSQRVARRMTEAFERQRGTRACSDCALAGLQIAVGAGQPPRHPVELLAYAYGVFTPPGMDGQDKGENHATVDHG
ncbi:MAG: ferredoxin [Firmicutes bacterium]|nr:ferredoxin [Alicyclobacillaceae bacterium]MCL6497469.1 ferredoxin [Bacillota bacterium]